MAPDQLKRVKEPQLQCGKMRLGVGWMEGIGAGGRGVGYYAAMAMS